jgi:excisionase family DNA binding protein
MSGAYLPVAAVADELGFSPRTVLRWIDAGHLDAVRLPGGRLRIPQSAYSSFIARHSVGPRERMVALGPGVGQEQP